MTVLRRLTRIALTTLLLTSLPAGGADRPAAGDYGEYLEVQLVNLELFATDSQGQPVSDLRRDEVRVFEDGKPVELSHFRAPAAVGAPESSAVAPLSETEPVRMAIFVDNLNTGPASRSRVLDQIWQEMDRALRPQDEVMVVTFNGSLEIQTGFSRDRSALRAALERASSLAGDRLVADLRDRSALEAIQLDHETNADGPCVYVGMLAREHADEVNQRVQRTLAALGEFIDSLAGIPGRKILLHVSDGIPLLPGAEAWNHAIALCDGSGGMEGVPGGTVAPQFDGSVNRFDPKTAILDMQSYDTTEQWRRLAAQASTQRVVFYPFFAPGLLPPGRSRVDTVRSSIRNESSYTPNRQDTLSILADETGGRGSFSTNDFRPAVRAAIDESLASYELAYVPLEPGDGRLHSVRVEVTRPGVRVRHRKSYQSRSVQQRVEDGVRSALFYGLEENPLEVRVKTTTDSERIVDGKMRVAVHISLPLDRLALLPREGHQSGLFTAFVAFREASGATSSIGRRSIPVRVPDESLPIEGKSFRYVVEMDLDLDPSTVAVALRDELGGKTSYVTARVDPAG